MEDMRLLKFITCGSVDDGKSTLIGHMLYDAKLLFSDQEKALKLESKVGSADGGIDYSLLLDGLMAEREQGITIDVAYRYFSTDKRSFIVADTPGHEEYTRNMAVGASFADLAIILIDASKGVLIQTKRHTRICMMMGIRHFVFAVNKMDLVGYSKEIFDEIEISVKKLMSEYEYSSLFVIPVSATAGDNITKKTTNMPWYNDTQLLDYLESVDTKKLSDDEKLILPIQRVCRPSKDFRGFQGELASGILTKGEEIEVLPSRERAKVKSIMCGFMPIEDAHEKMAVTITLDREIDISRGCVIHRDSDCRVSRYFSADLLWMDEEELQIGKSYLLKLATQAITVTISKIDYAIDVNTGEHIHGQSAKKNEIINCELVAGADIVASVFENNRTMGGFILIDRVSNQTSACGVIRSINERNLHWQNLDITREYREKQLNQRAYTLWFTGLSGAGKSTIANALEKRLVEMGKHTMVLDGDNIRQGLNSDLGFSERDRKENIRRVAEVAKLFNDGGIITLASFITPTEEERENARNVIGKENYILVHVKTSLEECERRDVKGLYSKARRGQLDNFTGIDSVYEEPREADIVVETESVSVSEAVEIIVKKINNFLGGVTG